MNKIISYMHIETSNKKWLQIALEPLIIFSGGGGDPTSTENNALFFIKLFYHRDVYPPMDTHGRCRLTFLVSGTKLN